jgi:excisionase family DNA binding protein
VQDKKTIYFLDPSRHDGTRLPLKEGQKCDDIIVRKKNEKKRAAFANIDGDVPMSSGEILNIKEVSGYLKIPVSTVYKLIQEGKIPAIKLGKHWRLMKKDIDRLFVHSSQSYSELGLAEKSRRPNGDSPE